MELYSSTTEAQGEGAVIEGNVAKVYGVEDDDIEK